MSKPRKCPKCSTEIGIDEDVCYACGENVPFNHPWYIMPLGGIIVLSLFWLLTDFDALIQYITQSIPDK